MEFKRLSVLDSLRGIAAMGIAFFFHYQHFEPEIYPFSRKVYWFYNYGWTLVDFFFVLSGFVFCYVYKRRISENKLSFKEYTILRFSRLYPLMFVTLIFVGIIQILRMGILHNYFKYQVIDVYHFLLNVFCIQSGWFEYGMSFNGPTWSISCEIVAYLLFYFFISKYSDSKKYYATYIIMIFLALFIFKTGFKYPLFNPNMARVFFGFFIGCFTYEFNNYVNSSKYKNRILIVCILIFLGVTIGATIYGHIILGNNIIGDNIVGYMGRVYTILIYPLILILTLNIKVINLVLSFKPFVYLGNLSFSIYLWHFPVQLSIKTIDDIFKLNINYSSKVFFFSYIIIILVVSVLSHELIEKPSNEYLRKKLLINK